MKAEMILTIGAALAAANVTNYRADSFGYGEFEMTGNGIEFVFQTDSECNISLLYLSGYDITNEAEELNMDLDWKSVLNGELYDKIHEAWKSASDGPYYDFYNGEYEE